MNGDQATELGKRIINTMRPTPALGEWHEVLVALDFDTALRTFRELRDRLDDGLRIAAFMAAYDRANDTASDTIATRSRREPSTSCVHCRGSGYEPGPSRWGTVGGEPYEYTTVTECRCTKLTPPRQPAAAPGLFEEF